MLPKPPASLEELLLPESVRRRAIIKNLLIVAAGLTQREIQDHFERFSAHHPHLASTMKPWLHRVDAFARRTAGRMVYPSLLEATVYLSGSCQLRCVGCATSASTWKRHPDHVTFDELEPGLEALACCGLKNLRVTGEGEPTKAQALIPLAQWAAARRIAVVACTNGLMPSQRFLDEFARNSYLYLNIKRLSDVEERQAHWAPIEEGGTDGVPFVSFGEFGSVPEAFPALWERGRDRLGQRITWSRESTEDVRRMLQDRVTQALPTFLAPIEEVGEAGGHPELVPHDSELASHCTRFLDDWQWWGVAVNAFGELIDGMKSGAMPRGRPFAKLSNHASLLQNLFGRESTYREQVLLAPTPLML